jgi:hypothetical protein
MPLAETASADARVLLYSQRNLSRSVWRGGPNEFEDVIAQIDDVRMVAPGAHAATGFRRVGRGLADRARARLGLRRQPHGEVVEIDGDYDLFFVALTSAMGLSDLQQLRGWRKHCRMAVCFIFEQWLPMVEQWRPYLRLLRDFDRVFVFSRWSIPAMQQIAQRPVEYLDGGIDTEALCPYPVVPPRMIDVYSLGRRSPVTHAALFRSMEAEQLTYIYDTVSFGEVVVDYALHRPLVRHLMKRSRYFLAYRVGDSPTRAHWGGEDAIPLRYFEGAAAGTVMLGTIPQSDDYGRLFDWPDATIEIPYEAPEIMDILATLDADPERLARARRNNVMHSLRRHDWVYRWRDILDAIGLAHTPGMRARIARLEHLADLAADDSALGSLVA